MHDVDFNNILYADNINSHITIFNDSEEVRRKKADIFKHKLLLSFDEKSERMGKEEFGKLNLYANHFDWILLHSLFISAFSNLEHFMKGSCEVYERYEKPNIKRTDISADGILDQHRKYLNLIAGIHAAGSGNHYWRDINEFKLIRNALIHNQGEVKNRNLKKIKEHDIIYGSINAKMIRIKKISFLVDFAKIATDYMSKISNQYQKKFPDHTSG